jgi:phosphoribosyl-AMP cyclohydrolase
MTIDPDTIDFAKGGGLVPVVVQDAATLQVLTLAYMDRAALEETIASGQATFFSRSRGGRWRKGETSGDRLHVVGVTPDCDNDALVLSVRPVGNACHLNRTSCFGVADAPGLGRIARLEKTIAERAAADPSKSWTARLIAEGPKRMTLRATGPGVVTAGQIDVPADIEVLNPDHVICTLDDGASIRMELTVQNGKGYVAAEFNRPEDAPIGLIAVDALYSPVKRVAYRVEPTRQGQSLDYDKLIMEVETNGAVSPVDAVAYAARILQDQLQLFITFEEPKKKSDSDLKADLN